jgi:NAD(P)-dependent dehydrogenase (short-subunit alcohol dehydrogenase family)
VPREGRGADVIALDICHDIEGIDYPMATSDDLENTAQLVRQAGGKIVTAQVDVRDRQALRAAVDDAVQELGGIDIVVANAGVGSLNRAGDVTRQEFDAIIGVNVTGTWNTATAALPHLEARDGGSITIISSALGIVGCAFLAPYAMSKHATVGLTRSLAIELADRNIRVNSICPTNVADTAMTTAATELLAERIGPLTERQQVPFLNALASPTVTKQEISDAIIFLAADTGRSITGTTFEIDAGLVAL